jgi:AcrR family transcriptional regulator
MGAHQEGPPARERILDAAAAVLRDRGIAHATTKEIAREAGCSEALLYKHFPDKHRIFMSVLKERQPALTDPQRLVGQGTVRDNLAILARGLMTFYVHTFPLAASIFGSTELLASWREGIRAAGGGPESPLAKVERYLAAEQAAGRLPEKLDCGGVAMGLVGASFHQGFLAAFNGLDDVPGADAVAERLVDTLLRADHAPESPTGN